MNCLRARILQCQAFVSDLELAFNHLGGAGASGSRPALFAGVSTPGHDEAENTLARPQVSVLSGSRTLKNIQEEAARPCLNQTGSSA